MSSEWEKSSTASHVRFFRDGSIPEHLIAQHGLTVIAETPVELKEKAEAKHAYDHSRSDDGLLSGPLIKHEH